MNVNNDVIRDAQAQSGSFADGFRREEGFEKAGSYFGGNRGGVIENFTDDKVAL